MPARELLTDDQRRHLVASLGRVERLLRELVVAAGGTAEDVPAVLRRATSDLPPSFWSKAQQPVEEAVATIGEIVATFGLNGSRYSRFSQVRALIVTSLVVVEDAASRTLRGYGAVHPRVPEVLDPLLDRLHEQLIDIGRVLPVDPSTEETPT
jgi:hypothetical protein